METTTARLVNYFCIGPITAPVRRRI